MIRCKACRKDFDPSNQRVLIGCIYDDCSDGFAAGGIKTSDDFYYVVCPNCNKESELLCPTVNQIKSAIRCNLVFCLD